MRTIQAKNIVENNTFRHRKTLSLSSPPSYFPNRRSSQPHLRLLPSLILCFKAHFSISLCSNENIDCKEEFSHRVPAGSAALSLPFSGCICFDCVRRAISIHPAADFLPICDAMKILMLPQIRSHPRRKVHPRRRPNSGKAPKSGRHTFIVKKECAWTFCSPLCKQSSWDKMYFVFLLS